MFLGEGVVSVEELNTQADSWGANSLLNIMVIGRFGTGKSTLARSLFGTEAESAACNDGPFSECSVSTNGVPVNLMFWSPRANWEQVERVLDTVDLVIFTLRMDDTGWRPEDGYILNNLSEKFGKRLWNKAIVALSFANRVTYLDDSGREQKTRKYLTKRNKQLQGHIQEHLAKNEVNVDSMPVVPVGHYADPAKLFQEDEEPWMSHLIKCILVKLKGTTASGGMWRAKKKDVQLSKGQTSLSCEIERVDL